ncbi:MAG: 2-amino-4-hydroxy-6-hydroxymethyldihydropteridine diphosphokinase [Xanthomonadales bacterium]|nr:2-amino-4-hydroxy-6-hydroxymethyldihydropteridine diphosphokinase [Xanthomonadales bacterium]
MSGVLAYIGLGSNLDDPVMQLRKALDELARIPDSSLLRHSGFYRTPPWGPVEQADFVNAVAEMRTNLDPAELLDELLRIERCAGRERAGERWGPRIIDLDLLVHGNSRITEDGLCVPHPRMLERAFVLVPLAELDASMKLPEYGCIADHLARLDTSRCVRVPLGEDP